MYIIKYTGWKGVTGMNFYDSFALNIYSLILLVILLLSIFIKREIYKYSSRLLRNIVILIIILLNIEMLSWAFDGIDKSYAYVLNYTFNLLFFILGVGAAGIFASYVDYMNFGSKQRLRQRFYYMHMFVFSIVLVVFNFFIPIIFSIDANNVYTREPLIILGFGAVYILLISMIIQTFRNRKNLEKTISYSIYIFILLPFIGGLLQLLFFGLLIMWAGAGLGIIIAYIFTETISSSKDFLTKLYTRSITNDYVERLIEKDEIFGVIMIDIDNFKKINDNYGHKSGDLVLVHFSRILEKTFPQNAIISRFGGDEFVVVIKDSTDTDLIKFKNILETNIASYQEYELIQKIMFSYGHIIRIKNSYQNIDTLLEISDKIMYAEKAKHKNHRRRSSD